MQAKLKYGDRNQLLWWWATNWLEKDMNSKDRKKEKDMNELSKEAGNVLYPVLGGGHRSAHSYQNLRTVYFNDISTKKVVKKKSVLFELRMPAKECLHTSPMGGIHSCPFTEISGA